jgi:hypothetical protein
MKKISIFFRGPLQKSPILAKAMATRIASSLIVQLIYCWNWYQRGRDPGSLPPVVEHPRLLSELSIDSVVGKEILGSQPLTSRIEVDVSFREGFFDLRLCLFGKGKGASKYTISILTDAFGTIESLLFFRGES